LRRSLSFLARTADLTPFVRLVVVDEQGRVSLANVEELDLYGVVEDAEGHQEATPDTR
jgi:hypothetical protein